MKHLLLKNKNIMLALLVALPISIWAKKADAEKSKTIEKNYKVEADHHLSIENKFGEVKITSWDKKEIQVIINIKVEARNEEKAQEELDEIQVEINENDVSTSFVTKFEKSNKVSIGNNDRDLQVDYLIKMPKSNSLKVENSFGAFAINDLDGKAEITVKFGSASIGKLSHPENKLTFEFSDPVTIEQLEKSHLTLKYSKMDLTAVTDLNMISEFSNSELEGVGNLILALKFGSVKIEEVIDAEIASNMSTVKIKQLRGKGDFKPKYGSLDIEKVSKEMTGIDINGEFSPIDISIEEGAAFEADIYTSMAGVNVPNVNWDKEDKGSNSKCYRGTFGEAGDRKVSIRSSFGKVKLDF